MRILNLRSVLLSMALLCVMLPPGAAQTSGAAQNPARQLNGVVIDEKGIGIEFVTIHIKESGYSSVSGPKGVFSLPIPSPISQMTLRFSSIGRKPLERIITSDQFADQITVHLVENSLTMDEIDINFRITTTENSSSSIVYDKEAIAQVRAFSLIDVLNTLPGRESVSPTILSPQTINLRGGDQGGAFNLNNTLGVAIVMDGIRLSNDANMQNRALSQFGMAGSILGGANSTNSSDVPFQGMDLRDIPVETIERIEVVQGVASAKYSEITDGAILIERQAGRTPYQFNININGGSTNYALSKGFALLENGGAINLGINYASSNADPRDKVKQYHRVSNSLMWTKSFGSAIRNTFSADFNLRRDHVHQDPDDDSRRMSYSRENRLRFSNRFRLTTASALARTISLNLNYSEGRQDNYAQWHLNQLPKGYTNKDTTGTYPGVVLGGRYLAFEQIVGNPITASADLHLSGNYRLGTLLVNLSYGANSSYSNNGGKGIIAESDRPRWVNNNMTNARPYDYESIPALINTGIYANNQIRANIGGYKLNSNLGLRYDIQNGYGTWQPRINNTLESASGWALSLGYGISTKSPTLAHRYPAPTYIDIPLLDLYANSNRHLFLVHTEKIINDNSHLKPSRSRQLEAGLSKQGKTVSSSLFAYAKWNTDGFNSAPILRSFYLPDYEAHDVDGQLSYRETGTHTLHLTTAGNTVLNSVRSDSYGLEWYLSTVQIEPIMTSFSLNHSVSHSYYFNDRERLRENTTGLTVDGIRATYFAYGPEESKQWAMMSKLTTTTHIPRIGFVILMNADVNWLRRTHRDRNAYMQGIAIYDENLRRIDAANLSAPDLIPQYTTSASYRDETRQPIIYGVINLSVTKEIRKNIRIGISAYNAFNLRPQHVTYSEVSQTETIINYNSAPTVTGGISIKF